MKFIKFPVSSTNIFPLANSTAGGQLLSEWNLRSRETVGTHSSVQYDIGPSYTHGLEDFKITQSVDNVGALVSSTEILISEGKAIVNGHFIQSLTPIQIDMAEANVQRQLRNESPLKGQLSIGLIALYSTEATMAGAMVPEQKDSDDDSTAMYYGVQVVILPPDEMKLPKDVPTQQDEVNSRNF